MGSRIALITTFLLVALASATLADSSNRNFHENAALGFTVNRGTCNGPHGACIEGSKEETSNSNTSRRALGAASRISYDALNSDKVPCNQRGSSYYNCAASGRANPYQRVCTAATRCARY